jgi:hypothetical protein
MVARFVSRKMKNPFHRMTSLVQAAASALVSVRQPGGALWRTTRRDALHRFSLAPAWEERSSIGMTGHRLLAASIVSRAHHASAVGRTASCFAGTCALQWKYTAQGCCAPCMRFSHLGTAGRAEIHGLGPVPEQEPLHPHIRFASPAGSRQEPRSFRLSGPVRNFTSRVLYKRNLRERRTAPLPASGRTPHSL